MFKRTHRYDSSVPKKDFFNGLIGNHVSIHNLDFEVFAKGSSLSIIPHAENVNAIKTLPITHVNLKEDGNKTRVVITSRMRRIDAGGPLLITTFCTFLVIASLFLLYSEREPLVTYTLLGAGVFIYTVFYVRMQMGYFDYVRKIRTYVKEKLLTVS
jgi:hypothetical protein